MQKEALNRRNAWEPTVFYSLGNETFFFTGQEINIRESLDSFGAVIWPGVRIDIIGLFTLHVVLNSAFNS